MIREGRVEQCSPKAQARSAKHKRWNFVTVQVGEKLMMLPRKAQQLLQSSCMEIRWEPSVSWTVAKNKKRVQNCFPLVDFIVKHACRSTKKTWEHVFTQDASTFIQKRSQSSSLYLNVVKDDSDCQKTQKMLQH